MPKPRDTSLFEREIVRRAAVDALLKLDPRVQFRNPVMFVVYITAALTTMLGARALGGHGEAPASFILSVSVWLWVTVLFANFAEALAEGRGKAHADALRASRGNVYAKKLLDPADHLSIWVEPAGGLRRGDHFLAAAGDAIPCDGEVVDGVAIVDESVVTGESAPVIREGEPDRNQVIGGSRVLSDWLVVRVTAARGESFVDRMIDLVEGASRRKTPNEMALTILLAAMTLTFLISTVAVLAFSIFSSRVARAGAPIPVTVLGALLVCLIPTTIGALLSAIGIAGIDRLRRDNVLALSGRAVEAAGDVDVLLFDKTGTITMGNREATEFIAAPGVSDVRLARAAQLASLSDETPEGRSVVVLAKQRHGLRQPDLQAAGATFLPFSAKTRMSGVDVDGHCIRKGATDAIEAFVRDRGGVMPPAIRMVVQTVARGGATPLAVAEDGLVLGVIPLRDTLKGGIRERFARLRLMGIKTVMVTGDNPLTAAAIAAEAGVDDFLAEATPEAKLRLIQDQQTGGRLVAMTGDGTNDAPALAQADVAVAMNSGTQAAKEAGNMVDLDSNPTKLIEIVETGKQLHMTRGALTAFSIGNDVAKYFAILPAAFVGTYPALKALNVMRLATPQSAILSAVIFNALVIVALIPLALRGVPYHPRRAEVLLRNNLLVYGIGGIIAPFLGIKAIDMVLSAIHS